MGTPGPGCSPAAARPPAQMAGHAEAAAGREHPQAHRAADRLAARAAPAAQDGYLVQAARSRCARYRSAAPAPGQPAPAGYPRAAPGNGLAARIAAVTAHSGLPAGNQEICPRSVSCSPGRTGAGSFRGTQPAAVPAVTPSPAGCPQAGELAAGAAPRGRAAPGSRPGPGRALAARPAGAARPVQRPARPGDHSSCRCPSACLQETAPPGAGAAPPGNPGPAWRTRGRHAASSRARRRARAASGSAATT
jgi:hypothetical protein